MGELPMPGDGPVALLPLPDANLFCSKLPKTPSGRSGLLYGRLMLLDQAGLSVNTSVYPPTHPSVHPPPHFPSDLRCLQDKAQTLGASI